MQEFPRDCKVLKQQFKAMFILLSPKNVAYVRYLRTVNKTIVVIK
jgi:hypothetical protein